MNNEQLRNLQELLRNRINSYHHDIKEGSEIENSTLAAMQMSQDVGEAKQARALLDLLPEPESDVVLDYRALRRICQMGVEDSGAERALYSLLAEKQEGACEVVEERLEIEEVDGRAILISDPVTKMQYHFLETDPGGESSDQQLELAREHFVNNIIDMGVE